MPVALSADACCAFSNLKTSRMITGGVRTTARAKLNSSAFLFVIPKRSPVDMVAPERENPRKGRQIPCTAPIQQEPFRSAKSLSQGLLRLFHPAKRISTPAAASASEIKGRFPKRSSTSAWGTPLNRIYQHAEVSPRTPNALPAQVEMVLFRKAVVKFHYFYGPDRRH